MTMTTSTRVTSTNDIIVVRDYLHAPEKVWRALTEPALMALWGMRPEGYVPVVGTRFKLFGQPNVAWRGFVECEVLDARRPSLLRYAWDDDGKGRPTVLQYTIEPHPGGSRLTVEHTGFTGIGGFLFAKLVMGPGLRAMVRTRLPAVLASLDEGERRVGELVEQAR